MENEIIFLKRIDLQMKEYESQRTEMMDSIKARNQIVAYGLPTIAVLIGVAASVFSNPNKNLLLVLILINVLLPAFSNLFLLIWMGEVERMMRSGWHVRQLERIINSNFQSPVLTWEINRRAHKVQTRYSYLAIFALFAGTAIGSSLFCYDFLKKDIVAVIVNGSWRNFIHYFGLVLTTAIIIFLIFRYDNYSNEPKHYKPMFDPNPETQYFFKP